MQKSVLGKITLAGVILVVALFGLSNISRSYHELDSTIHTYNMELVGYLPDVATMLSGNGSLTEVQKHGDYAYISYVYDWTQGERRGGFFIIDVTDPTNPTMISQFEQNLSRTLDVKINEDATIAVLSGETLGNEQHAHSFQGITIVDITNKANPVMLSQLENFDSHQHEDGVEPEASGVHNVFVHGDYVYYTAGERGVAVVDISNPRDPIEVAILPNYVHEGDDADRYGIFPHDMYVQTHPRGRTFAYIADWDGGLQIWDVTVPEYPLHVGEWLELGPTLQNTHYVRPTPSGDITVVGPEMPSGFSGFLSIVDTSDVQNPRLLSTWAAPGHRWQHSFFQWTQHNFDVTENRIFLGNYGAGVWVIDITDRTNPTILGSFGPESFMEPPHPDADFSEELKAAENDPLLPKYPWVGAWGVEEEDGLLYVGDMGTGFYILQLESEPVVELQESTTAEQHNHNETESGSRPEPGATMIFD